ncbi:MAG: hypothetical protein WCW84_06480 [Sulfurimonas sp.]|jgi:hypothetical protein
MTIQKVGLILGLIVVLQADPYALGHGVQVDKALNVGGYFSTEFSVQGGEKTLAFEDLAIMAYGDVNPMFSYMTEFESIGFYQKNLTNGIETSHRQFHAERAYGDVWLSDAYNIRFGKQITPIGYWNREPINVLRDMSSNPLYCSLLFPKFLTGIDINGYIPRVEGMTYHLFGQKNPDLDDEYVNIRNKHFFGLSVEKELSTEYSSGGSIGEYITLTEQRTRFLQLNAKYDDVKWQFMSEVLLAKSYYSSGDIDITFTGYAQGMFRYSAENAILGRYEHFKDHHVGREDNIAIVGYSYRPSYPISLKGEYQLHSLDNENRALFSFSVLF